MKISNSARFLTLAAVSVLMATRLHIHAHAEIRGRNHR